MRMSNWRMPSMGTRAIGHSYWCTGGRRSHHRATPMQPVSRRGGVRQVDRTRDGSASVRSPMRRRWRISNRRPDRDCCQLFPAIVRPVADDAGERLQQTIEVPQGDRCWCSAPSTIVKRGRLRSRGCIYLLSVLKNGRIFFYIRKWFSATWETVSIDDRFFVWH